MTDAFVVDTRIGKYVTRYDIGVAWKTRPHKVESIVSDEPVTKCGRRLRQREGTQFRYEDVPALAVCEVCG